MQTHERGNLAQAVALSWLQNHGYALVQANYRRRIGEIDLVVLHPDRQTVVFVEVRYRSHQRFGGAIESVDRRKQQKLVRTADAWLQQHASSMTPARIDVIALCPASPRTPPEQLWQGHQLSWIVSAVEQ
ncbi:MAG: YraN family protein [Granulosicoccus sp.]|nr:YraN family protein [Granulosicoccus sp.]